MVLVVIDVENTNAFLESKKLYPDIEQNPNSFGTVPIRNKRYKKLKLLIRTYLPFNYVFEPKPNFDWGGNISQTVLPSLRIDLANVRDYPQYKNIENHGSFKSKQEIIFDFENSRIEYLKNTNPYYKVPDTHVYTLLGGSTISLPNMNNTDNSLANSIVTINNIKSTSFFANISLSNPAVSGSPAIDYDLKLQLREDGLYTLTGIWDGFPAIEVFLEDLDHNKVDLIYSQLPERTRGADFTEFWNGQIFKLLPLFGDTEISKINFLGKKPHIDKSISPYAGDVLEMIQKFKLNPGFETD
jgi:Protein of unknown function (DUF3238)